MDDARKRILERRARFVAAAIATLGASSCKEREPLVCLSPVPQELRDTGTSAADTDSQDSQTQTTGEPDAPAMPCLAPPPATSPPPLVCLSPMPPPTTKGT